MSDTAGADRRLCGDYAEAERAYAQSLTILRAINQVAMIASTLGRIGRVAYAQGRYVEARQHYLESLALSREAGSMSGIAVALNDLGTVACAIGNERAAGDYFRDALAAAREADSRSLMLDSLTSQAPLLERAGRHEAAVEIAALVLTLPLPDEPHGRAAELRADRASRLPAPLVAAARQRTNVQRVWIGSSPSCCAQGSRRCWWVWLTLVLRAASHASLRGGALLREV